MIKRTAIIIIVLIPISLIMMIYSLTTSRNEGFSLEAAIFLLGVIIFIFTAGQFKYSADRDPIIKALFSKKRSE